MYRSVYLLLLPYLNAFLLEPNNEQNATGGKLMSDNHYLTIARFLEAQQEQHRDTEKLHKTMEDTISVLASQIQSKFADLERKLVNNVKKNETCRGVHDLEKKMMELENNYTTVLYELQIAKDENANMKHRFSLLMNETYRVDERVNQVEQLKKVQSLQDLQTIHNQIQSITAQTLSLSQNQFARNQDFVALYNQTSVGFVQAVSRLKHLESFQNVSLSNTKVIEDQLKHLEAFRNISIVNTSRLTMKTKELQTQITNDKRPDKDRVLALQQFT
ncbi:Hypothetical predicted protein [Mytilus galloprovincialis]|uniref:Uncharacterized protein n=1 Tax=Mytilus galloprovincialis TaxID=29158 RepID=A0A8B6DGC9_MYTGA|nr:Hypothetical predicted protein [Mytilus galloprovincialis]